MLMISVLVICSHKILSCPITLVHLVCHFFMDIATTDMTGDDPPGFFLTDQLRHAPGDVAVTGAVKSVASDAELLSPLVRYRIDLPRKRDGLVERRLERRHLRHVREFDPERLHRRDIRRVVR